MSPAVTPSLEAYIWRCWCYLPSCLPLSGKHVVPEAVTREPPNLSLQPQMSSNVSERLLTKKAFFRFGSNLAACRELQSARSGRTIVLILFGRHMLQLRTTSMFELVLGTTPDCLGASNEL